MKYINKLVLCALVTVFLATGCNTEELQELNINPQAVNEIDLNYLFSSAELGIADGGTASNRYLNWRTNIGLASTAIQQLATPGSISAAGNFYRHNEETASAPFEYTYGDQLKNIAEVILVHLMRKKFRGTQEYENLLEREYPDYFLEL